MIDFQNMDCMLGMKEMADNSVDLTLTDIPYGTCNEENLGKLGTGWLARKAMNFDKGVADKPTFELLDFLKEVFRVTNGTFIIFCDWIQLGDMRKYLIDKKGTMRTLIWEKINPSVFNGQYIYLNGIECALWFKKNGKGTFNAHCKNTIFRYPIGIKADSIHPTEKDHGLLAELIADNSNEGDLVFDPCAGSGSTLLVARKGLRRIKGFELHKPYYDKALARLNENASMF